MIAAFFPSKQNASGATGNCCTNVGNRKDSANNPPPVDRNPPDDEPQPGPWLAQPKGDALEAYLHGDGAELIVFGGKTLQDIVGRYNLYCGGQFSDP